MFATGFLDGVPASRGCSAKGKFWSISRVRDLTDWVEAFSPATASEFSLLAGSNTTGNFTKIVERLPVRISIDPRQEMSEYLAPGLSVTVTVDTKASQS